MRGWFLVLRLFLSDTGWNTLSCPKCDRELVPAYETEDGLEVAYWRDFDPGETQTGLLVCGEFNCDYEEPVIFSQDRADSVVISLEETLNLFELENTTWISAREAQDLAEQMEEVLEATGRGKLKCGSEYYRQIADDRLERIEAWLAAAGTQHKVSVTTEEGEQEGRLRSGDGEAVLLEKADGQLLSIAKLDIVQERILYPRKPRPPRKRQSKGFYLVKGSHYFVVEGYHLYYWQREDDGRYSGLTDDPAVAAALRLPKFSDQNYRGIFDKSEIERFYFRRHQVKIRGHWLEDRGRSSDEQYVSASTTDPAVGDELEMGPEYAMVYTDFGTQDGDVVAYSGSFPVSWIEDTSWYEEVQELPER